VPPGSRERIQPYLSAEIHNRFYEYCNAKRQTESAVVEAALTQYLELPDSLLVMRRLDRLGRSVDRMHRDVELLSQAFSLFLQCWFAHAPTLPPNQKDAARRTSASRFQEFMEQLAEQFSNGRRFLDDLPKDVFADEGELRAMAVGTDAPDSDPPKREPS
jgi:hypothetical protein